jgi:hypothetical protein
VPQVVLPAASLEELVASLELVASPAVLPGPQEASLEPVKMVQASRKLISRISLRPHFNFQNHSIF